MWSQTELHHSICVVKNANVQVPASHSIRTHVQEVFVSSWSVFKTNDTLHFVLCVMLATMLPITIYRIRPTPVSRTIKPTNFNEIIKTKN